MDLSNPNNEQFFTLPGMEELNHLYANMQWNKQEMPMFNYVHACPHVVVGQLPISLRRLMLLIDALDTSSELCRADYQSAIKGSAQKSNLWRRVQQKDWQKMQAYLALEISVSFLFGQHLTDGKIFCFQRDWSVVIHDQEEEDHNEPTPTVIVRVNMSDLMGGRSVRSSDN